MTPSALRLGLVGTGNMAAAHSTALALLETAADRLPIERVRVAGRRLESAERVARQHRWSTAVDDWRAVTRADDIDAVIVVTPNNSHEEISRDAARHGKHVLCEKPLALTADAAAAMLEAARAAGVVHQTAFVLRHHPAIACCARLVRDGLIGRPLRFRGQLLQDHYLAPHIPTTWRLDPALAGGGAIVDLGSHVIDLARFLVGDIVEVQAGLATVHSERPSLHGERASVGVDDEADLLVRFASGARGTVAVSWAAAGHKTDIELEIGGDEGALRFRWRRGGEFELYRASDGPLAGFRSIVLGPEHVERSLATVAGAGVTLEHAFAQQARVFAEQALAGEPASPDFEDGLAAASVVAAAIESARSGHAVAPARIDSTTSETRSRE
jgi:predicted dehydrogenase